MGMNVTAVDYEALKEVRDEGSLNMADIGDVYMRLLELGYHETAAKVKVLAKRSRYSELMKDFGDFLLALGPPDDESD
jgi:hypothetical protein